MSKNLIRESIKDEELGVHTNWLLGVLERVDVEQGREMSVKVALMNVYANCHFLFATIGDIATYDMLKELRGIIKKAAVAESKTATKH